MSHSQRQQAQYKRQSWQGTKGVPIVDADGRPLFGAQGEGNNLIAPCVCGRPTLFTPSRGWNVDGVEEWKRCDHCKRKVLLREECAPSRRFVREVRK